MSGGAACDLSGSAMPDRQSKATRATINPTDILYGCLSRFNCFLSVMTRVLMPVL